MRLLRWIALMTMTAMPPAFAQAPSADGAARSRADRKTARRDQFRQQRAGAEGRGRRAARRLRRSRHRTGKAARRAGRVRALRRRGQGVRGRQGRRLGYRLHGHRAGARRRDRCSPRPMWSSRAPTWCGRTRRCRSSAMSTSPASGSPSASARPTISISPAPSRAPTVLRAEAGGGTAMIEKFLDDKLDVAAGVRQQLDAYAKDHPEMRVMAGHFQEINAGHGHAARRRAAAGRGRRLSRGLRRGDEGHGLCRRCADAQRPGGAGRAAGCEVARGRMSRPRGALALP